MKTFLTLTGVFVIGNSGWAAYLVWERYTQHRRAQRLNDPRVVDLTLWLSLRDHPAGKGLRSVSR